MADGMRADWHMTLPHGTPWPAQAALEQDFGPDGELLEDEGLTSSDDEEPEQPCAGESLCMAGMQQCWCVQQWLTHT